MFVATLYTELAAYLGLLTPPFIAGCIAVGGLCRFGFNGELLSDNLDKVSGSSIRGLPICEMRTGILIPRKVRRCDSAGPLM